MQVGFAFKFGKIYLGILAWSEIPPKVQETNET